jgi:hypothetical protein
MTTMIKNNLHLEKKVKQGREVVDIHTFHIEFSSGFLVEELAGVSAVILGAAVLDLQAALQPILGKLILSACLQLLFIKFFLDTPSDKDLFCH